MSEGKRAPGPETIAQTAHRSHVRTHGSEHEFGMKVGGRRTRHARGGWLHPGIARHHLLARARERAHRGLHVRLIGHELALDRRPIGRRFDSPRVFDRARADRVRAYRHVRRGPTHLHLVGSIRVHPVHRTLARGGRRDRDESHDDASNHDQRGSKPRAAATAPSRARAVAFADEHSACKRDE